ncbi:PstA family ABC transporter permease [Bdellovibrio sp. HCB337]|uniref:PstA family ABC transporter permease n=1 Tax=Bdellovibrio sp. HCB337 TaxID=3394358 RepID=UPI0039A4371D
MSKKILVALVSIPVIVLFGMMISNIILGGHEGLSWDYFVTEVARSGKSGGIGPVLVSTIIVVLMTLLISTPFSFCCAVFLSLVVSKNRFILGFSEISLSLLSGLPSIVFGLFGSALFGQTLGLGYSLLSGALTLSCMVLPFYTKILYDNFKILPREYLLSAKALDLSLFQTSKNVLIPMNLYAIAAGAIFSMSRALGETAALVFTSGYVDRYPHSIFDSGRTLSIHIYDLALNVPAGDQAAMKASFVFLLLSLSINFLFSVVLKKTLQRGTR